MTRSTTLARVLLLLALLPMLLLAACGDDDDDDDGDATSVATVTAASGANTAEATAADSEPTATVPAATATVPATSTTAAATATIEPTEEPTEAVATATEANNEPTVSTTQPAATMTAGTEPVATVETEGDPALAAQLADVLVTLDELPAGWTIWDTGADDDNEEDNICGIPNLKDQFPPVARAEVSYQASDNGPFLSQSLGALSEADAAAGMAVLEAAFADCATWTDPDGVVYTLEDLEFPELGDEIVTRRVTGESSGFTLAIEVAYIRDRGFVIALAHYGVDEVDSTLTVEVAQTLLDRLADVESPE